MTPSLIRDSEDVHALLDIGLLFGGMALFYVALLLVRSETGVLIVFFRLFGFLAGRWYGDRTSPVSADRLQAAWEHLRPVANGMVAGAAIGVGVDLAIAVLLGARAL
jgi:hypothetical protein